MYLSTKKEKAVETAVLCRKNRCVQLCWNHCVVGLWLQHSGCLTVRKKFPQHSLVPKCCKKLLQHSFSRVLGGNIRSRVGSNTTVS